MRKNNKNIIALALLGLLLVTGCAKCPQAIETITIVKYPNLQDIPPVDELVLNTPEYDLPRDLTSDLVVKNISTCINVPEENRNDLFWARCGEYPIIPNSNIYRGFDYDNWVLYLENMNRIREHIRQYKNRIDEVNRQRREWRALNAEIENSSKKD